MTDEKPDHSTDPDIRRIQEMLDENLENIRKLNDDLRVRRLGGAVVITPGIAGLGAFRISRIFAAVSDFVDFNEDNDPHGEHDCAVMTIDGVKIIWKIDYYDLSRRYRSPDASDINVTSRVMTILRADEY